MSACPPPASSKAQRAQKRQDAKISSAIAQIAGAERLPNAIRTLFFVSKAAKWTKTDLLRIQASMNASPLPHHPSAKHERKIKNEVITGAIRDLDTLASDSSDDDDGDPTAPHPPLYG